MDKDKMSTTTAFNKLPIELNKAIAHCLPTDNDIGRYCQICKATNSAVDGDKFSFWRAKFREKFAMRPGMTNKELRKKYRHRVKYLRWGTKMTWGRGHSNLEQKVTDVLRDLIIESFQSTTVRDEDNQPQCLNQVQLSKFILSSKTMFGGRRLPPTNPEHAYIKEDLAAVRLMCAHLLFNMEGVSHEVLAVDESQRAVYAPTNMAPLYGGPLNNEVNMEWVLHCLNFFRHHMVNPDASLMNDTMEDLEMSQRPSAWRGPLETGCYPLSTCWKGTYAYLEASDLERFRKLSKATNALRAEDIFFNDCNVDEGKIQSLKFEFVKEGNLPWPNVFEERLHSLRQTLSESAPAQHSKRSKSDAEEQASKNIQITGVGEDLDDSFSVTGWLNPLPNQCNIPGWQRITFMKHFETDLHQVSQDNLWAYEGVVLPGGRIILGRWWYASDPVNFDNDYGGPFILWAVEPEPDFIDETNDDYEATNS